MSAIEHAFIVGGIGSIDTNTVSDLVDNQVAVTL